TDATRRAQDEVQDGSIRDVIAFPLLLRCPERRSRHRSSRLVPIRADNRATVKVKVAAVRDLDHAHGAMSASPLHFRPAMARTSEHPITVIPNPKRVRVLFGGRVIADTTRALTLREGKYPPVQYI